MSTQPPAWPGLFLGLDRTGAPICAGREQSVLVMGPPRSGKTAALVDPCVLTAPGAVVATSTKTDVLSVTVRARSRRGRCWVFDPSDSTARPEATEPLRWSPVSGCESWSTALAMAHALVSAARPVRSWVESPHWLERAEALIGPLLHAAALGDQPVRSVVGWILGRELTEAAAILHDADSEMAAAVVAGIAGTEARERSGIFSTAAGVLSAYRDEAVCDAAASPNFALDDFVRSADTVYVSFPGAEQDLFAPLVVALLEQIRRAVYRRPSGWPPVVWALDEAANIAPLPSLPSVVSDGGSQGLVSLVCLQDLSQARVRWGAAADGFFSLFGTKVVLGGIADLQTLQLVSALGGERYVPVESETRPVGFSRQRVRTVTTSPQRLRVLPVEAVARGVPGHALVISGRNPPGFVGLSPYWHPPWSALLTE
ncbi:MAG: type IV secretory system conjugative DNA transfer family protein [Acidimicrobiia bacterium]|nr:type IV secretory system conjugative DNA transfer family protein [Acidimicrobiia bacterium]